MQYDGYLIDLDGTMYRGNESIAGAKEFIHQLQESNIPHMFITNNSTSTRKMVVEKLRSFAIKTTETQVLTSAIATATYVKNKQAGNRVYVIGEEGLELALKQKGLTITEEASDFVIVGLDRAMTYEKIAQACLLIRNGATFISTNKDAAIPTDKGLMPGNGSLTAMITYSTGVKPSFIGKPERIMVDQALKQMALQGKNVLMVGDNYETDIKAGINANIDTMMVLTGFSTKDAIKERQQPTYIVRNLLSLENN